MKLFRRPSKTRICDIPLPWLIAATAAILPCLAAGAVSNFESEFIPFPEVTVHFFDKDVPNTQQHGSAPLVDFFYTAQFNDWRVLSELLVSDDERDLERLIIGRITANGRQFWLGRNHSDLDQWNRLFHRETYLQTSIHRPGIIEFEDDGGVLPAHITGLTIEDDNNFNGHNLNYRFTIGLGPGLKQQHLVPLDLLKPNQGSHNLSLTAIVSDQSAGDNFKDSGLFMGYTVIPSNDNTISKIKQGVIGAYTNYSINPKMIWRASAFYVSDDVALAGGGNNQNSFGYAYVQPEYNLNMHWTFYGRKEGGIGFNDDLFVQQIPSFISDRTLVGTRYQMENSQVIKFEIAKLHQYGQRFMAVEVQWSAAFQ